MRKNLFLPLFFGVLFIDLSAKEKRPEHRWNSTDPFEQKVFVANKGQFDKNTGVNEEIFFQAKSAGVTSYFTKKGVFYRYDAFTLKKEKEGKEREREEKEFDVKHHSLEVHWLGANPAVEIVAEEKVSFYYTYSYDPKKQSEGVKAPAYKKIIYRNLYPNIDAEYTFPEDKGGIKYSLILHPGANLSDVRMKWNDKDISSDASGNLIIKSSFGDFIDHAPTSFYEGGAPISSAFELSGNIVSFRLPVSNIISQTIIIDPWTSSPTFATNKAYDVNYDFAGNVYAYGSANPYQLVKFNSGGALQWVYNAVIVSSGYSPPYYGDFAVDGVNGTSYMGEGYNGTGARIEKVNSSGVMVGSYPGYANMREIWRMDYNYCNGTVLIGGGGTSSPSYQAFVLDTGLVSITPVQVVSNQPDIDAALLSTDKYSNFGYMLFASGPYAAYNNYLVKCPLPGLLPITWGVLTGHTFSEVFSVNYVASGVGMANGFNGLAVSPNFVYSYDGSIVKKWNKTTGALVSTLTVSGTMFSWGGLDVDECDNLYVGVQNTIKVYDVNWAPVTTYALSNTVYDIRLASTKIYASGDGFVSEIALVTTPTTLTATPATCSACNGSATVNASTCSGSVAFTYSWMPGGQTTQTATNLCPGNYTVTVFSNCSVAFKDTITVKTSNGIVSSFTTSSGCLGTATTFTDNSTTASGTVSSWNWNFGDGNTSTVQNPTHTYATAGSFTTTLVATSSTGCFDTIKKVITVNSLPVVTVSGSTVCANATVNLTSAGGTSYSWTGPNLYSSAVQNPSILNSTTAMSGTYSVTVTDANGCINGNSTTVTVNPLPIVTASSNAPCAGFPLNLSSAGGTSWSWSGPNTYTSTLQNPSILNATIALNGVYSVVATDANGCTGNASVTIAVNPLPIPTIGNNSPVCENQTLNLNSGGGTGYLWSGPNSFSSILQNPSITGVTLPANGTYTVTVTDANGCVNTATVNSVINPLPIVPVSGSTVCVNATVNLTSAGGTIYSWTGPNSYSSAAQNPSIPNAVVTMSGTYSVTVTDANGCVNGNSAQVLVNPLPIITINSATICVTQQTATLTAAGANTYSWSPAAGLSSTIGTSVLATPTITSTYLVTGTDVNSCVNTNTTSVTVNPLPTVTVNSATICVGQQTATLIAGGANTYSWSPAAGLSSTLGNSVLANPVVTSVYLVTGTDLNACVNTATASVTVNPLPIVTVSGSTVCTNATVNLSSSPGGVSYSWSGPNAFSSNLQNPNISNANVSMTGSYALTVIDANGCINGNVAQVLVNALPIVSANAATICLGQQTATLIANGANTYAWSPTTGLSSSFGTSVTANPSTSTIYTIIGTDVNNCQSTATTTVTVNPLPLVSISPQTASGCAPVCVNFSNTASGTGTCSWNFGDGTNSSSCMPSHCFTGKGTFGAVLSLTDNNGCVNTSTATVVVYPVPVADFNASPQPTTILEPLIQFTDATTGAVIASYNWTFGDPNNSTSTLQNPAFNYQAVGTYPVLLIVTSNYGCIDSTVKFIKIDDEYMLYVPNAFSPNFDGTNDVFFAKGEGIKDFKMYIFDRWGNQVFFSDDIYKGWDGRFHSKGNEIVQEDVYVWKIECKTFKGESRMLKGHVSLIK